MVIKGVIRPPPEIRAVADRTASYVAKNGRAFETRILSSAKGTTPKFAFLQPSNPFHAYYQDRIQFYENGGEDATEEDEKKEEGGGGKNTKDRESAAPVNGNKDKNKIQSKATHSAIDPVAKTILTHRNRIAQLKAQAKLMKNDEPTEESSVNQAKPVVIPPPQPLHYIHIIPPASLTIVQIETIQLVAQMTALDGKGGTFLSALTRREWNNPQFNFTQPRHGHFAYFSALVDAYRQVLTTWTSKNVGTDVKEMANNPQRCLEVAAYRAEYNRYLTEERRQDDNVPQVAYIDWQDFVVVETIDFGKHEQVITLPPPPPSEIHQPHQPQQQQQGQTKASDEMHDSDDEDDGGEQIRVVGQYRPTVVSAKQQASSMGTVVDPITGKSVRVEDMPEHMRIQLMDPKWAEERKKFQDKQKDSNLVGGDVVAQNLARLATARGGSVRKSKKGGK